MSQASDDEEFLKILQTTFISEAELMLEDFDEALLNLEAPELREKNLNQIFRVLHSLKGSALSVGFIPLANFSHCAEDLLCALRVSPQAVNQECISALLKVSDVIKAWIVLLNQGKEEAPALLELETQLKNLTAGADSFRANETIKKEAPSSSESKNEAPASSETWDMPTPEPESPTLPSPVAPLPDVKEMSCEVAVPVKKSMTNTVVKIDSERVDALLNVVGELVVLKGQLMSDSLRKGRDERFISLTALMDKSIRELQDRVLSMRMTSLKPVFLKLQRGVRDTAIKLNKDVDFEMLGEETEIDRTLIDLIADPLMHVVRNAVDHGIESSEKRIAAQKFTKGKILVRAERRGDRMLIEVSDNGGGISREKIANKARERGLLDATTDISAWPDKQVFDFLMQPGFSTAEIITDVSGRGVGLDVVKSNLEELKGRLEIESTLGAGSCFRLSIPLTTAIIDAMLVQVAGSIFIIPIDAVQEFVQLADVTLTQTSLLTTVVNIRGLSMPVFHLQTIFESSLSASSFDSENNLGVLVVVHDHDRSLALRVDKVIGQSQIVVKGLAPVFEGTLGIGGAAQLEDGSVGLILDVEGLNKFLDKLTAPKTLAS